VAEVIGGRAGSPCDDGADAAHVLLEEGDALVGDLDPGEGIMVIARSCTVCRWAPTALPARRG